MDGGRLQEKERAGQLPVRMTAEERKRREEELWRLLTERQGCVFHTAKNLEFTYKIRGGELFVDRKAKSITQSTVYKAFYRALELEGKVSGPKKLGTFGASYLYPIFMELSIIEKKEANDKAKTINGKREEL